MTKQELLDKANDLPLAPGVYLMMDKTGCVIYVGKAKKLKNRVSQYFQENSSHNEKTRRMVSQVDHFDTIFVSTEFEALILENSLIKQHMPRYNILLKDDKGYPFVRLGTEHYPRFTMASKPADDNALYFGPFGGRNETRAAIDAICAAFRLPTCSRKFPRDIGKERPCLNHHMGRCDAFCRGTPDEDEYMRRIGQAEELLNGHYRRLTRALREEMEQEAADLHFEQAAALRDRIRAIEVLGKRQKVIAGICADTDIWGVYRGALKCGSAVLHIEDGSVTGRDLNLFAAPQDESEQMILSALLPQYYLNKSVLPREILLPCEIEGAAELAQILTERAGRKVTLHVPQRGEKAELLAMAQRNAREDVERVTTAQERENRTLTQLAGMLSLSEPPERTGVLTISRTPARATSLRRWSSMRAQSPRRAPTGDSRSRACRPTRTTMPPWKRCSRAASSAIWTGTRNSAPCRTSCSSTAASRTRASPSACARRCMCTCRSSAWSGTTATARARSSPRRAARSTCTPRRTSSP